MTHDKPFYSGAVFETLALDGTPQSPTRTLSHGWSSGPTSALSKYVLGVRPVEPGYKTWLIEPQPADLTWAQGSVPTPYGPIALRWQKQGNNFMLNASIPRGTNGTIGIPLAVSTLSVTDNGRPITAVSASKQVNGRTGYVYVENMGAGTHLIEVK
jgi:alpha-L-rhamnosidase